MRTSGTIATFANMLNMYVGIAIIAFPASIAQVGFVGALIGIMMVATMSCTAAYFLIKARNRFKRERIIDFVDIGVACYGPWMGYICKSVILMA